MEMLWDRLNVTLDVLTSLSGPELAGRTEGGVGEIELPEPWSGLKPAFPYMILSILIVQAWIMIFRPA